MKLGSLVGIVLGVAFGILGIALFGPKQSSVVQVSEHRVVLAEADGALGHVVLHWTPNSDAALARPYSDFLRAIESTVSVTFLLPKGLSAGERALFDRRLYAIDPTESLRHRATLVEVEGPITAWSKDRALVSGRDFRTGKIHLIIPAEPPESWVERHNDWRSVSFLVKAQSAKFELDPSPFDFDAGDIAVARGTLIIDGNLLEKNRRRGYGNLQQLAGRLGEYLHMPVATLGQSFGDTPRHHLSMYMTPLTGNRVLVGDPAAARAIVGKDFKPGEVAAETGEPLLPDFSPETQARFDRAAMELSQQGFAVTRIANVPFDDKTYFAYTNAVFEVRGRKHIAYVPNYEEPPLDEAANEVYRRLGWQVVPIHVRSLYTYHGTIGCVVNVLERR